MARLGTVLAAGDPQGEVLEAWGAKERLRAVYSAPDLAAARRWLTSFYQLYAAVDVPELRRLARTISGWTGEILAYHRTGLSNGPTEAVDLLIGKIRRVGHGFRNFD